MKQNNKKLVINYPCVWLYKIIGMEKKAVQSAIAEIFSDSEHTLTFSNSSSKGKYISFDLEVTVCSEESRNFFFSALKQHTAIKMVL